MIKPLTALRFFFALCVFLSHYAIGEKPVFYEGYIGVGFFFILSGFIIAYNYKGKIREKTIFSKDTKAFIIARIARIYPLHCVTFLFVLLLTVRGVIKQGTAFPWKPLWFNVTLLHSFIPIKAWYFSFNAVSWSISDELFFYLMFPVLLAGFANIKRKLLLISGLCVLGIYSAATVMVPNQYHHALFYINPFIRIIDFIIGIGIFSVWEYLQRDEIKHNRVVVFLTRKVIATIIEVLVVFLLIGMVLLSDHVPQVYRYASYYWLPMALVIFVFALANGGGVSIHHFIMETIHYCRGSEFRILYAASANDRNRQGDTKPYIGKVFDYPVPGMGISDYIRGGVRGKFS
jgi:peptidoglycan/LPS O-acetylase OafA/YrhL